MCAMAGVRGAPEGASGNEDKVKVGEKMGGALDCLNEVSQVSRVMNDDLHFAYAK
jgi:hypothetical protein